MVNLQGLDDLRRDFLGVLVGVAVICTGSGSKGGRQVLDRCRKRGVSEKWAPAITAEQEAASSALGCKLCCASVRGRHDTRD